jgi:hypothetical protein
MHTHAERRVAWLVRLAARLSNFLQIKNVGGIYQPTQTVRANGLFVEEGIRPGANCPELVAECGHDQQHYERNHNRDDWVFCAPAPSQGRANQLDNILQKLHSRFSCSCRPLATRNLIQYSCNC